MNGGIGLTGTGDSGGARSRADVIVYGDGDAELLGHDHRAGTAVWGRVTGDGWIALALNRDIAKGDVRGQNHRGVHVHTLDRGPGAAARTGAALLFGVGEDGFMFIGFVNMQVDSLAS